MIYALALDLQSDPALITEYERLHQAIWPEVADHLGSSGVTDMKIYRLGTRLFMLMETDPTCFSFAKMAELAAKNPAVQEWEAMMWRFQQPTPWTPTGEKWVQMQCIFQLSDPMHKSPSRN